jgi:hypothetical protein
MNQPDSEPTVPAGVVLTDTQIKRLKIAIAIMSALMIVGIITLIVRVIYLASGRSEQAGRAEPAGSALTSTAVGGALMAEIKLALPAGASLKATSLSGNRLVAHYASPKGEGVVIVDLSSGKVMSHVRIGE